MQKKLILALAVACLPLAACGGDNDAITPVDNTTVIDNTAVGGNVVEDDMAPGVPGHNCGPNENRKCGPNEQPL